MKHIIKLAFVAIIWLTVASCGGRHSNNINISQTSNFDRHLNKYAVETELKINNRFGFSQHVSVWEDETSYKSDVDDLLKLQKKKADSVCRRYK